MIGEAIRAWVGAAAAAVGVALFAVTFRPEVPPQDGKIHVRYWEKWTGFEEQAMRDVVTAFNRRQDRIHVDYLAVSQVNQKMLLATAGGNPPDVAGIWDTDVVTFADYDALTPLESYLSSSGLNQSDYIPGYWEMCVHRGHVFAMPTTPATVALHWNKAMFRQAGLDPTKPPRTIEELDQFAEKLTRRDAGGKIVQMGFLPAEPGWWNWSWGYFFGGKLWDGEENPTLTTAENLRAFNWVKGYVDRYETRDIQVFQSGFGNFSSPQNAFMSGQVAMVLQGVWMANFIKNNNGSLDWDAAPFPHPANRPDLANPTPMALDVLVVPRGASHPREAWEFIRFVQSQEGMEMLCTLQWKHSPLLRQSEQFLARHPNKRIRLFQSLATSPNAFLPPHVGIWREWNDEMGSAFQNIWVNGQSAEEALGYSQRRLTPRLQNYLNGVRLRYRSAGEGA